LEKKGVLYPEEMAVGGLTGSTGQVGPILPAKVEQRWPGEERPPGHE
jgi:hypothetical protein